MSTKYDHSSLKPTKRTSNGKARTFRPEIMACTQIFSKNILSESDSPNSTMFRIQNLSKTVRLQEIFRALAVSTTRFSLWLSCCFTSSSCQQETVMTWNQNVPARLRATGLQHNLFCSRSARISYSSILAVAVLTRSLFMDWLDLPYLLFKWD